MSVRRRALAPWASAFALVVARGVGAYHCEAEFYDYCNGTHHDLQPLPADRAHGVSGCTAYAAPLPSDTDWLDVRRRLVNVLFGVKDGRLPARRKPDAVVLSFEDQVFGNCLCATRGLCPASACAKQVKVRRLVWTIKVPVNDTYTIALNSTALLSFNTSGLAPDNEPPSSVIWPEVSIAPNGEGDTLVIYHNGHGQPCTQEGCSLDQDGTIDWLNRLGYDTLHMFMPLYQCNHDPSIGCDHAWFDQFLEQGAPVFRLFLEPVVLAINYAIETLGYRRVVLIGLSGGGWTTTLAAAIDPRIMLSLPVAGSIPCDFRHESWDFEQYCDHRWAQVANYTSLYVLAALERGRASVQMLHEADNCCFHTCHRHERIREYNTWVRSQIEGGFVTSATAGNMHEVNDRDKVVIASLIERFRANGKVSPSDLIALPFNLLAQPEADQPLTQHVI